MHAKKWLMIVINLIGGIAVLGSYVYGILTHPNAGQILWGGVPQRIRPFYTAGMLLAATGYFAFTYFILFRLNPNHTQVTSRFGFGVFNALYATILIPSALWMPLTFLAIEQFNLALLWTVRMVLVVVGAASVGLFFALLKVKHRQPLWVYQMALVGSVGFCIQTVILDAVLWGAFFRL
jgi:hypothetical protein